MPGIFGAKTYALYKKEMDSIVSKERHAQLMSIDPEYANAFKKFFIIFFNHYPIYLLIYPKYYY